MCGFSYNVFRQFSQIKTVEIEKSNEALGIQADSPGGEAAKDQSNNMGGYSMDDVINIALFGLDKHTSNENGRSDSIIIFTIDYENKEIKMSSIMRDLRVPIENHGKDKINAAYSYGGPQLAIKTINQNFGTDIKDYIAVDFEDLEKIIDYYEGVNIDVKDYEIPYMNELIDDPQKHLHIGGVQLLNGKQAVAFSRVRYAGNGDFERTERQRKVLKELILKTRDKGIYYFPGCVAQLLPYVQTSMDKSTILSLGKECFSRNINTLEEERFPVDGYWRREILSGIYYLTSDLVVTKQQITDFIYNNKKADLKV